MHSSQHFHPANTFRSYIFEPFILFPLWSPALKICASHRRELWIKASTCQAADYTWALPISMSPFASRLCACLVFLVDVQSMSALCASGFFEIHCFFVDLGFFFLHLYLYLCKITRITECKCFLTVTFKVVKMLFFRLENWFIYMWGKCEYLIWDLEHLCSKIDVFTFDFLHLTHIILKCTCAYRLKEFFTCKIAPQKRGGECLYFWIFACVRW